jgi:cytoskeleton protein RodZ
MDNSVGQQLRRAREARSLSLEEVANATRIRLKYLGALEADQFDQIPSHAQARGFLRVYASFLRLDGAALLSWLDSGEAPPPPEPEAPEPAPELPPGPRIGPEAIFVEVGEQLKRQRDLLGLSLEDVARHTHLRLHYLEALEGGDLTNLPSPVQGRGMLSNYAAFLGLDPEPLLLRFAEGLQQRLALRQGLESYPPRRPSPPRKKPRLPAPVRRFFSGDLLLGGALGGFLVLFLMWGAFRIFTLGSQQTPQPTPPAIVDMLLATPSPTITLTPEAPTPTRSLGQAVTEQALATLIGPDDTTPTQALPLGQGVNIYLTVLQRTWMRVKVDDRVQFSGRALSGSAYTFGGERQIEIVAGNAAAVQIFFNGQDQGRMGSYGELVSRIYTRSGVVLPTATITPTPTVTPPTTPTPTLAPEDGTPTRPALP